MSYVSCFLWGMVCGVLLATSLFCCIQLLFGGNTSEYSLKRIQSNRWFREVRKPDIDENVVEKRAVNWLDICVWVVCSILLAAAVFCIVTAEELF